MVPDDVVGALDHVALDENRNAVFICSVEMCFMFVAQINVIFMRPLYEAVILCDCIINVCIFTIEKWNRYNMFLLQHLHTDNKDTLIKCFDTFDITGIV